MGELLKMHSGCFCCRSNDFWFWKEQGLLSLADMNFQKMQKMALTTPPSLKLAEAPFLPKHIKYHQIHLPGIRLTPTFFDLWFPQILSENLRTPSLSQMCLHWCLRSLLASKELENRKHHRLQKCSGKNQAFWAFSHLWSVFHLLGMPLINKYVKNPHGILRQEHSIFHGPQWMQPRSLVQKC